MFEAAGIGAEPEKEECQRCHEAGHDRRTLWMECGYDMEELGVSLSECGIEGRYAMQAGERDTIVGPRPVFRPAPDAPTRTYQFYTMRVCKDCRGAWMLAIQAWFRSTPAKP